MNDTIEIHEEKEDRGFTLVELLIVIVILGILAAVTVFAVAGITGQAQQNTCGVEERTLQTAIESYRAENQGADPGGVADVELYLTDAFPSERWSYANGSVTPLAGEACAGVGAVEEEGEG